MQSVIEGGPAAAAGARPMDIIRAIDGASTNGLRLDQVVDRLRGAKGTDVEVVLQQPEEGEQRTYTITRGVVPIPGISKVGYSQDKVAAAIRIDSVTASTVHELRQKETELADKTEVVVLDVRQLRDHKLHYGKLLANALIDDRPVGLVETRTGQEPFDAEPGRLFADRKLVLVISAHTGGTLEWIAAAIQDQQQGLLLGVPTNGSGYASETVAAKDSDLLIEMPVARLRRAGGQSLYHQPGPYGSRPYEIVETLNQNAQGSTVDRPLKRLKINRQGPGISPDFVTSEWDNARGQPNRDAQLTVVAEQVLKLLPVAELSGDAAKGE